MNIVFFLQVGGASPRLFWVGKVLTVDSFSQNFCGLEALDRCQQLPDRSQYIAEARWRRPARSRKKKPVGSRVECCVTHFRRSSSLWLWRWKQDLRGIFPLVFLTSPQVFPGTMDLHRPVESSLAMRRLAVLPRTRFVCGDFSGIAILFGTNFCLHVLSSPFWFLPCCHFFCHLWFWESV